MPHVKRPTLMLAAAGLVAATLLSGCASGDVHVYESTALRPTSVAIVDTVVSEPVWSMDIPIGYRLELAFERGEGVDRVGVGANPPEAMEWTLQDLEGRRAPRAPTAEGVVDSDVVDLPGRPVMIVVSYRDRMAPGAPLPTVDELEATPAPGPDDDAPMEMETEAMDDAVEDHAGAMEGAPDTGPESAPAVDNATDAGTEVEIDYEADDAEQPTK